MPANKGYDNCESCARVEQEKCPSVKCTRGCGHHCDHSWSHDECCWCGIQFGEDGARRQRVVVLRTGRQGYVKLPIGWADDLLDVEYDDGAKLRPVDHMDVRTIPDGRTL